MLLLTFGPIVLLLSIFTNGQRMCENPSRFDWQEVENQDDFYVSSSMSTSYSKWKEQFKALENNEFAITDHIPNPICAAVAETESSNCHEGDMLLPKWYLSMKCILACNANMGLAGSEISETEVYCDFSRNNTLEQPVGSAEWGASCYCPSNSKLAQLTVNIPYVTLTEMLDEYNRLFCHDKNSIEETIFLIFEYNGKEFTDCNDVPNICDNNARCQRKSNQEWFMCVCNDGYVGDGFECRRTCIVELGDGNRRIIKFNGELLTGGETIVEGDVVEVKCIIFEHFQQNATCDCDGEIKPLPVCKRAIYIFGGEHPDSPVNEEPTGVFFPEDVGSSKMIMTPIPDDNLKMFLAFNYENVLYAVNWITFGVQRYDTLENAWKLQLYGEMYEDYGAFGTLVGSKYYKCGLGGCQYFDIRKNEWIDGAALMGNITRRSQGCSFLLRNVWYLVAGNNEKNKYTNVVEAYNFTSDGLSAVASYPISLRGCAATSLNDLGYVCGGNDRYYYKECYVFLPSANNWSQINSMAEPRIFGSLVESNGFLFALLGYYYTGGSYYAEVEKYDPDTDQWEILSGVADKIGKRYKFGIA